MGKKPRRKPHSAALEEIADRRKPGQSASGWPTRKHAHPRALAQMIEDATADALEQSERQRKRATKPRGIITGIVSSLVKRDLLDRDAWRSLRDVLEQEHHGKEDRTGREWIVRYEDERGEPDQIKFSSFKSLMSRARKKKS